jgi:hypothetical protein
MAKELAIQAAGRCPTSRDAQLDHTWVPGDGADVLMYGDPDVGLSINLGRCRYCHVALLSIGEHGSEQREQTLIFEVRGAELSEDDS